MITVCLILILTKKCYDVVKKLIEFSRSCVSMDFPYTWRRIHTDALYM